MSEMTNSEFLLLKHFGEIEEQQNSILDKIEDMAEEVRVAAFKTARETLSGQGFDSHKASLLAGILVGKVSVSENFWDQFYGDACDVLNARQGGAA